ncbi:MAG: DNA-protecting protein DprA [Candidatus Levybacteria bacterium]|nr:DNA-protecting protein DprA [Candidatus Levybacteria bacterium]
MDERVYWLVFSVFPGIGPVTFQKLLHHFESVEKAWRADVADLKQVGIGESLAKRLAEFRATFSINDYAAKLKQKGITFLILTDDDYPKLLKQIKTPPFVLYIRGKYHLNDLNHFISVVGTRKITQYGREVTTLITQELVQAGCVIVSGLAIGVDAVAHATTIENGGKTIAVLGGGVDVCYPSANQELYNSIVNGHGAVVSEYPLGATPTKGSFPSRNRIIAGLSEAVVVTEGAEDSGALITAAHAASLHKSVFAVPGPITSSLSKGPFKLLQKGAKLVTSGRDVLDELNIKSIKGIRGIRSIKGDNEEEQRVIDLLQNESLHFDEIVKKTGYDSSQLGILLSLMEIKGLIKNTDGTYAI